MHAPGHVHDVHGGQPLLLGYVSEQAREQRVGEAQDGEPLIVVAGPDQGRLVPSVPSEVVVEEDRSVKHLVLHSNLLINS